MRGVLVVAVLLTLGSSGCQSARSVVPVDLRPADLVPPTDSRLLTTHDTAVRGIAAMLARDFGLPVPDPGDRVRVWLAAGVRGRSGARRRPLPGAGGPAGRGRGGARTETAGPGS